MERRFILARNIVIAISVVLSSVSSCFFTMIGASAGLGEMGLFPVIKIPVYVWVIWGIAWGAACGYFIGKLLIKALLKRRNALFGFLYGLLGALVIGSVNGFLTGTLIFGVIIGAFLGPGGGLILAAIFLLIYKPQQT